MKIKTTVPRGLKKISNLPFDKALELSAQAVLQQISSNADKGKGYKGSFTAYSKKYGAIRAEEGLTSRPNLQFSGEMMRSILNSEPKSKKTVNGYTITITPPDRQHTKAKISIDELVEVLDGLRPFYGINSQYEKVANKKALDFLSKEYAKLQLS